MASVSEGPASRLCAAEQQRLLPLQKSLLLEIEKLSKDKATAEAKALKPQAQLKASQDKAAKSLENSAKLSKKASKLQRTLCTRTLCTFPGRTWA